MGKKHWGVRLRPADQPGNWMYVYDAEGLWREIMEPGTKEWNVEPCAFTEKQWNDMAEHNGW